MAWRWGERCRDRDSFQDGAPWMRPDALGQAGEREALACMKLAQGGHVTVLSFYRCG